MPFASLKAWIAEQEAYERLHGHPAPLTDEQRLAVAVLALPTPPPAAAAPDLGSSLVGDEDWVSLLNLHIQAQKGIHLPAEFEDESVIVSGSPSPHWRCRCRVPSQEPDKWFPLTPAQPFQRKKAAKQYAARCAIEWLRARGNARPTAILRSLPSLANGAVTSVVPVSRISNGDGNGDNGSNGNSSSSSSPDKRNGARSDAASASLASPTTPYRSPIPLSAVPSPSAHIRTMTSWRQVSGPDMAEPDTVAAAPGKETALLGQKRKATTLEKDSGRGSADLRDTPCSQLLETLCDRRGLGKPIYRIWPSIKGHETLFSGTIEIAAAGSKDGGPASFVLPESVGVVENVYTRKATKERIARDVYQYLKKTTEPAGVSPVRA